MYKAIIVTHQGPCYVTKHLYLMIVARKAADSAFSEQILFALEIDLKDMGKMTEVSGTMELVKDMPAFEKGYLPPSPRGHRSILT